MFTSDNPVAGDHWYVMPPPAFKVVASPSQIFCVLLKEIIGFGLTNTFTKVELVHPYWLMAFRLYRPAEVVWAMNFGAAKVEIKPAGPVQL